MKRENRKTEKLRQKRTMCACETEGRKESVEKKRGVYGERRVERNDVGEAEEDPPQNTPAALGLLPL